MLFIKNTLDYSVCFKAIRNNKEEKFVFDCKRIYSDTGNIATTGVTPIDEKDFNFLYENMKQFKDFVDTGKLCRTKEEGAVEVSHRLQELEDENKKLNEQLAEATKKASTANAEEIKKLNDENENLKKQLEALAKGKGKAKDKAVNKDEDKDNKDDF